MKLAHLADLHLGFRQYERQTTRGGNQREADVADAFRRAVDDLIAQRPDLIVLAGDVFHSVRPTNPAILFLFQQLQRLRANLPAVPIVMVAGEHDTPRSVETGTILRLYEALGVDVVVVVGVHRLDDVLAMCFNVKLVVEWWPWMAITEGHGVLLLRTEKLFSPLGLAGVSVGSRRE